MKRIVYLLIAFIGVTIVGCEPMDDINDEIDAQIDNVQGSIDYTLVDDDYTDILELEHSSFSTLDDAKAYIPGLLKQKFPALGNGSAVNVGFNLYDPIRVEEYTVTDADYAGAGLPKNYVTATSEVKSILDYKYDQAELGDYVKITYKTEAVAIQDTLTDDDYDLIGTELAAEYPEAADGAAYYNDFEKRAGEDAYWTDEMIAEAIIVVLNDRIDDAVEGQLYAVTYDIFVEGYEHEYPTMVFRYDGNGFNKFNSTPDGEYYEYTESDYSLVATELADEYPDQASNLAEHGNFYRKYTDSDSYWTDEMLIDAASVVLNDHFPDAEEGKVFEIEFDVYGNTDTETFVVEKIGDSYELATSISITSQTDVYAYTNGSWSEPLMIPSNLYQDEFEQTYSNFGNEDDVAHYLGVYLRSLYPYAEEGDVVPVGYRYYNGEATVTQYSNFIFENGDWNYIPSVKSTSLQFGNENGTWVPDNTIRYSLATADYLMIADEFADVYPAPAASMEQYKNFEQRGNSSSWDDDMILEALQYFLQEFAPNAEEGQKYLISYAIYNGTNTTGSMHLIKENGEWIPVE